MTQTVKNIIAVVILGGVGLLGYILFMQKDTNSLMFGQDSVVSDVLIVQARTFVQKRQRVEAVTIDATVFTDPRFTTLTTYTVPVVAQPVGKTSLFESAIEMQDIPN